MSILEIDLSAYSEVKPSKPVNLLFIHQSVGGQLMADQGFKNETTSILKVHQNGGGLKTMLGENNYVVHEASYGSNIGDKADICHWNRNFRNNMDRILRTRHQNIVFNNDARNRVVMFQSDFFSNWIESDGAEPGNPNSEEKTTANYKAAYRSLLKYFQKEPETLFIALTAPPLAKPKTSAWLFSIILRKSGQDEITEIGKRARLFNKWLKNINSGWLSQYPLRNVVVFDYYHVLTAYGASNWLMYSSGCSKDNYPTAKGNKMAAQDFIPFINRAMNRAGKQVSNLYTVAPQSRAVP